MELFKDFLSAEESLFSNEDALQFDFLPPILPHRENEVGYIADCIKPLFSNRSSTNLLIYGGSGIGKSASVRFVFDELKAASENIITIYVNCWENTTTHAIMIEIGKQIGLPFPTKGIATDVISKNVFSKLRSFGGVVICFDEIDKAEELDYLYTLSEDGGKKLCVLLVTNDVNFMTRVDPRIRSRLCLEPLEFKDYKMNEIYDILRERVKYGFVPGVMPDDIIRKAADVAFGKSDVRAGIFLLWKSGRIAEDEGNRKVSDKNFESASNKMIDFDHHKERELDNLDDIERKILELIRKMDKSITGEIYDEYKKTGGTLTERSFRMYIKKLENMGLVRTEETGKGFRGRSRIITVIKGKENGN